MTTDFNRLIRVLADGGIECVLVGGVAAIAHGAARTTFDVDIVYSRNPGNLHRLVASLGPLEPYLRGAPPGLPFRWDVQTIRSGLNFTLTTAAGEIDLLGEVAGGGTYEQLLPHTQEIQVLGVVLRVVTLEKLIQLKRAAGRPKDLEAIAELQALLEERRKGRVDRSM